MKQASTTCSLCHKKFLCGAASAEGACWCAKYPPIIGPHENKDCLCETCLKKEIDSRINVFIEQLNSVGIAGFDFSRYRTNDDIEGIDYYLENGNLVFTKWYHLKRGYCCENGCRHCPYGYPSQSRS